MTPSDPLDLVPPDDSGSSTVSRFIYQARVIVPYVVLMGLDDRIDLIVCEHFEDVAIRYVDESWTFAQIKSRDPELGPWTLASVCRDDGGAFRSLLRTHRSLRERGFVYKLGAWLEGSVSRKGLLNKIKSPDPLDDVEIQTVSDRLGTTVDECRDFLARVHVKEQRLRQSISETNIRVLGSHDESLSSADLLAINDELEALVMKAMGADLPSDDWVSLDSDELRDSLQQKIITRELIEEIIARLHGPIRTLLRRIVDPSLPIPTRMVEKLLTGGADESVVDLAARRRADAHVLIQSHVAATMGPDEALEDVEERVLTLMTALQVKHKEQASPADAIFADAVQQLTASPQQYDPNRVLHRDPFLLIGLAADLSDRCRFNWGIQGA